MCVVAPLFVEEVVDVVPFGLRARCELFVLHARLVGILLLPLDFVAASAVAAADAAAASQQLLSLPAAGDVRMNDEMA